MSDPVSNPMDFAQQAVEKMLAYGADQADALVSESLSIGASSRLGNMEDIEHAESADVGLRALIGTQQAFVSSSGMNTDQLDSLAERAVAMARMAPSDPFCGLADTSRLAKVIPQLDLVDASEPEMAKLTQMAIETEETARAMEGITNSEGAGAGWAKSTTGLVTSDGFAENYSATSWSLSCAILAGSGENMERDYAGHTVRHREDLETPQQIGSEAASRALARLNPCKLESRKAPVIYDKRVSASLLGHFAAAISGSAIARGTSFLKDCMSDNVFSKSITVADDPKRIRGLRSMAFDAEGLECEKLTPVSEGQLNCWLLDSATGKQLDMPSNGRAARGIGSPPSPSASNLYIEAGSVSLKELMQEIGEGLYVTELIGMGVNGVTGDYSRGAAGYWIENGELAYPVSEITIAGNLKDMFKHITPADDLSFRYSINAPTLLVEEMTLAGL